MAENLPVDKTVLKQYALTLTLNPKMYQHKPKTQYKRSVHYLNGVIIKEKLDFPYMYPELTPANNVHYHGTWVTSHTNWFYANNYIHELFRNDPVIGYIKLVELDKPDGWLEYCTKQQETIEDLLTKYTFAKVLTRETMVEHRIDQLEIDFKMKKICSCLDFGIEEIKPA